MRPGRKCVEIELTLTEMYTRKAVYYTPPHSNGAHKQYVYKHGTSRISTILLLQPHDKIPTEEEGFCLFVLKVLH